MEIISDRRFFISCAVSNLLYSSISLSYKSPVYMHIFVGKQVSWFFKRIYMYCTLLATSVRGAGRIVINGPLKPWRDCSLLLICLWFLPMYSFLHNIIFFSASNGTFCESALFCQEVTTFHSATGKRETVVVSALLLYEIQRDKHKLLNASFKFWIQLIFQAQKYLVNRFWKNILRISYQRQGPLRKILCCNSVVI